MTVGGLLLMSSWCRRRAVTGFHGRTEDGRMNKWGGNTAGRIGIEKIASCFLSQNGYGIILSRNQKKPECNV